jgi:predicted transcriptional regulator
MKKPVYTIPPKKTIKEAAKLMQEKRIGSLVVVEQDKIIGIITERDLIRSLAEGKHLITVEEKMSSPVITCEPDTTVEKVMWIMKEKGIRHIPVVREGKVLGIVSSRDIGWLGLIDVISSFHTILISYCKVVGDILGSGAAIFTSRFLNELLKFYENGGVQLPTEEDPKKAVEYVQELMDKLMLTGKVNLRDAKEGVIFEVRNCILAKKAHPMIGSSPVICPLAIIAAAILRKTSGKQVKVAFSEVNETGTKTHVRFE